jgi:uncharacterized protein
MFPEERRIAMEEFPQSVIEQLGYYVYLLTDPETQQVFYVGKGTANRVFHHAWAALTTSTESDKLDRIRAILAKGKQVEYQILRHGLTEKEAFEVESALIDYIGMAALANAVVGFHSDARGKMSVVDIIAKYNAPQVTITEPVILITLNRLYHQGMSAQDLYESTRGNWVIGSRGRSHARYAFAVFRGIIREVYSIHRWEPIENLNPVQKTRHRWRFEGEVALPLRHYVGGSVEHYSKLGAQNPLRYVNC